MSASARGAVHGTESETGPDPAPLDERGSQPPAAGAACAHRLAAKYVRQEVEYAVTADELRRALEHRPFGAGDDDAFVLHSEHVI